MNLDISMSRLKQAEPPLHKGIHAYCVCSQHKRIGRLRVKWKTTEEARERWRPPSSTRVVHGARMMHAACGVSPFIMVACWGRLSASRLRVWLDPPHPSGDALCCDIVTSCDTFRSPLNGGGLCFLGLQLQKHREVCLHRASPRHVVLFAFPVTVSELFVQSPGFFESHFRPVEWSSECWRHCRAFSDPVSWLSQCRWLPWEVFSRRRRSD